MRSIASSVAVRSLGAFSAQVPERVLIPGLDVGQPTKSFALRNVTVIDGTGRPAVPQTTVVIAGNRLQSVAPAAQTSLASSVEVVDATGKFLIPGLWDMHTHLQTKSFPLFIPNGVTGVRAMGEEVLDPRQSHVQLRAEIASGKRLGPCLIAPFRLNGWDGQGLPVPDPQRRWPNTHLIVTPEDGRDAVRAAVQEGSDFVKVRGVFSRNTFLAIAAEAKSRNIPLAGHVFQPSVGEPLTLTDASNAGMASIEHGEHVRVYIRTVLGGPDGVGIDGLNVTQTAGLFDLFALLRRNGTWFCPTLTDTPRGVPIVSSDPRLRYFDPAQRKIWETQGVIPPDRADVAARNYRGLLSITAAMHQAGVGLLAGTDVRSEFGMPGFWIHEELRQLVAAGLSSMEALQTATFNSAKFLGLLGTVGTIEAGKLSEMVLLDANPLDDITNTTKINMVFTGGNVYRRPALDAMLKAVEQSAQI